MTIKKTCFIGLCAAVVAFTSWAWASSNQSAKDSSLLYSQSTATAIVKKEADRTTLSLQDIPTHTIWFTDRPNRSAGRISVQNYLKKSWHQGKNSFSMNHPNAIIMYFPKNNSKFSEHKHFVAELSEPVLSDNASTLTYTIKAVHGDSGTFPSAGKIYNVFMLIDNGSCWLPGVCQ